MLTSLWTSESGLMAMQQGMDVLGYNIANVNTDGFKKNDVTFQEILQRSYNVPRENINPMQKGLGASVSDIRTIMAQGSLRDASSVTDLGIAGKGFFVLEKDGETLYSRVGNFEFDAGGNSTSNGQPIIGENGQIQYYLGNPTVTTPLSLVNKADGAFVQGWMADPVTGEINSSGSISNIGLTDNYFNMSAQASTYANLSGSIDADNKITTFNSNKLQSFFIDYTDNTSDINEYMSFRGNALNNEKGTYDVQMYTENEYNLSSTLRGPSNLKVYIDDGTNRNLVHPQYLTYQDGNDVVNLHQTLAEGESVEIEYMDNNGNMQTETFTSPHSNNQVAVVSFDADDNTNYITTKKYILSQDEIDDEITRIIPGMAVKLKNGTQTIFNSDNHFVKPVNFTIDNSGKQIGEQFSSVNTIYDSNGMEHQLLTTLSRESENKWNWKADLFNVEHFKGTGNAQNFALDYDVDTQSPITVTNGTQTLNSSQFELFEGNKIISEFIFDDNNPVSISYTDKNGIARTEYFEHPSRRQILVLDKNIDPDTIDIYVNSNNNPTSKDDFQIVGNKIMPVDKNGDGIADVPFTYPGADIEVRYRLSSVSKGIVSEAKDEFPGSGYAENFELTHIPDSNKSFTVTKLNNVTGEQTSVTAYSMNENVLSLTGSDNILKPEEKLIIDYTPEYKSINITQDYTIVDTISGNSENEILAGGPVKLSGAPDLTTLTVKVNGTEIPSSAYEISGDLIVPIDTDNDGIPNQLGNTGDTVQISYDFVRQTEGTLTFDANGNVIGGDRNAQVSFNIKTASDPINLKLNFENIIQNTGTPNDIIAQSDGNAEGILTDIDILKNGVVSGLYSNSLTQDIAKISLATFANPGGLKRAGDNYFEITANSGDAVINAPTPDGDVGVIYSDKLETSNVNLSQELTNMIVYQRAFQLDSKGVSTSNEMLMTAINLKRY